MVNLKSEFNLENVKALFNGGRKTDEEMLSGQLGKYEINLVPDVKAEMLKQQHIRNVVFFVCLVVAGAAAGVAAVLGMVKGGQDIAMATQDSRIEELSKKINDSEQLSEFLTIQDQLGKISTIEENKSMLSRVFNALVMMQPQNNDTMKFSELNIDMKESTLTFEAQANSGEDTIDYRVLESFKKNVGLMTYDYGRYVDDEGNEIPTRCIVETDESGNYLTENGYLYGIWKRGYKGCDPKRDDYSGDESNDSTSSNGENTDNDESSEEKNLDEQNERIWRTPQFEKWYKGDKVSDKNDNGGENKEKSGSEQYISEDGVISGLPHFESACFRYSYDGGDDEKTGKWVTTNECKFIEDEMTVTESSNARDDSDELVLRFSAVLNLNPEMFKFTNKHMIAVAPFEQNVTDSYRQVNGMDKIFAKKAKDCKEDDSACKTNGGE